MKRILVFLLAVIITAALLCACGSQPADLSDDPIIGSWVLTGMASETETGDASDVETVYTFDQDGTVSGIDNGTIVSGTWKKANTSYIVTTDDNTKMKFILDDDTLTYEIDFGGMSMINFIFERK